MTTQEIIDSINALTPLLITMNTPEKTVNAASEKIIELISKLP